MLHAAWAPSVDGQTMAALLVDETDTAAGPEEEHTDTASEDDAKSERFLCGAHTVFTAVDRKRCWIAKRYTGKPNAGHAFQCGRQFLFIRRAPRSGVCRFRCILRPKRKPDQSAGQQRIARLGRDPVSGKKRLVKRVDERFSQRCAVLLYERGGRCRRSKRTDGAPPGNRRNRRLHHHPSVFHSACRCHVPDHLEMIV